MVVDKGEDTRILGGQFNIAMKWQKQVNQYKTDIVRSMRLIEKKHLSTKEAQMASNMVIQGRNRYYLNVTPLIESEAKELDKKLAVIIKHTLSLAGSTATPMIYESSMGLGTLSTECVRAQQLVANTLFTLNHKLGCIKELARTRFKNTLNKAGIGIQVLGRTDQPARDSRTSHMLRLNNVLRTLGWKLGNQNSSPGARLLPNGKRGDNDFLEVLPEETHSLLKSNLVARNLLFVGQIANSAGTQVKSWFELTGSHKTWPSWYTKLVRAITTPGHRNTWLVKPVAPLTSARTAPNFIPGTFVLYPDVQQDKHERIFAPKIGQVLNNITVNGQPHIMVRPYNYVRTLPTTLYYNRDKNPVKWGIKSRKKMDNPVTTSSTTIILAGKSARAIDVQATQLRRSKTTTTSTMYVAFTDTTLAHSEGKKVLQGPNGFLQVQQWTDELAAIAFPEEEREEPIHPAPSQKEAEKKAEGLALPQYEKKHWRAASDGSLKDGKLGAGVYKYDTINQIHVLLNKRIPSRHSELCSYRAEMGAVLLLFNETDVRDDIDLTMDNLEAKNFLQRCLDGHRLTGRELIETSARMIALSIQDAVEFWKGKITVTWINSHMEDRETDDPVLRQRRKDLAEADIQADEGREAEPLYIPPGHDQHWLYPIWDRDNQVIDDAISKAVSRQFNDIYKNEWMDESKYKKANRIWKTDVIPSATKTSDPRLEKMKFRTWLDTTPFNGILHKQHRSDTPYCRVCTRSERGEHLEDFHHMWYDCKQYQTQKKDLLRAVEREFRNTVPVIKHPNEDDEVFVTDMVENNPETSLGEAWIYYKKDKLERVTHTQTGIAPIQWGDHRSLAPSLVTGTLDPLTISTLKKIEKTWKNRAGSYNPDLDRLLNHTDKGQSMARTIHYINKRTRR